MVGLRAIQRSPGRVKAPVSWSVHTNPQGLQKKKRERRRFVIVRERLFGIISLYKGIIRA